MNVIVTGTLILACIYDASSTANLLVKALGTRGVTLVAVKSTETINKDASKIIDFAGWSMAGISIIGIIKNAMGSIGTVSNVFVSTAEFIDKITFWN